MNEIKTIYDSGGNVPLTLEAFKNREFSRLFINGYIPPEPEEVKALIKLCGWKQLTVAKITGVTYSKEKGSSSIRKWLAAKEINGKRNRNSSQIPYTAWRLLLQHAGVVNGYEDVVTFNNLVNNG